MGLLEEDERKENEEYTHLLTHSLTQSHTLTKITTAIFNTSLKNTLNQMHSLQTTEETRSFLLTLDRQCRLEKGELSSFERIITATILRLRTGDN
jgi:hypothetical protein